MRYAEMETKYGAPAAYQSLLEIEKVAGVRSWEVVTLDPEIRLANALRLQDSAPRVAA